MEEASRSDRILPPHIEQTVAAIARLHAEHARSATPMQRGIAWLTDAIGRPRFLGLLLGGGLLWMGGNLLLPRLGWRAPDPPPFAWLEIVTSLMSVCLTALILTTQRRDDEIASHRDQLTLELAIMGDRKVAKLIGLMEEMRRDDPALRDRRDPEAEEMAEPADPQAVLEALWERRDEEGGPPEQA